METKSMLLMYAKINHLMANFQRQNLHLEKKKFYQMRICLLKISILLAVKILEEEKVLEEE
jgi:hypothetical protein